MEKKNEYRIHIVGNRVVASALKRPGPKAHPLIRNHAQGWVMDYATPAPPEHQEYAVKGVERCGFDFAALDVCDDGVRPYVLELNLAPGILVWTAAQYAREFSRVWGRKLRAQ